ncbi:MAG: calcium-binding protein, partial [Gammaproteobacteria bacterium]|nr:calcium-binding protein [Gammaproteobacteria bacterium]
MSSSDPGEGTVPASVTVAAANWDTGEVVTITGVDDAIVDGPQGYTITTGNVTSSDAAFNALGAGDVADVSVTNADDDAAGVIITPTSGLTTTEAGGTANFTVTLATQPTAAVTIVLSSSDPGEGTVPASVTVPAASWNTGVSVTVTGQDDALVDGPQGYTINTGNVTSGDGNYNALVAGDVADVSVTNADDDAAGVIINPTSGLVTTEDGESDTFLVTLTSQPTAAVTIALSSSDPGEGTVPASVTVPAASWNTGVTVIVTGVDDILVDGNIVYTIITGNVTSSDAAFNALGAGDVANVSVTNTDDDSAGFSVAPLTLSTTENGPDVSFSVVLNSAPTSDVVFSITSGDTSEGTVFPGTLTFTPGNWNIAQDVDVTPVDDPQVDGPQTYNITVSVVDASSADSFDNLSDQIVSVTNNDDETAGFSVSPTSLNTAEGGSSQTFTVALDAAPASNVVLLINSQDTSEGTVSPASFTFTPVNWNSFIREVSVTPQQDVIVDGDITYNVTVSVDDANSNSFFDDLPDQNVSVTNADDDAAGVIVSPISGNTTEDGVAATFQIFLESEPSADVTIPLSSNDPEEGSLAVSSAVLNGANWFTGVVVTVTGVNDDLIDGAVTFSIVTGDVSSTDPNYASILGSSIPDVTVINNDNDEGSLSINNVTVNE